MKKILAILLAATMLLALAACGTAADTATEPPADETAPASEAPAPARQPSTARRRGQASASG